VPRPGPGTASGSAAVVVTVVALACVLAAGCGRGASPPAAQSSVPGGSASGGGSTASPSSPVTPGSGATGRDGCVASTDEATVRSREAPGRTCLIVGATLNVTSEASPLQPWAPLSTSDPSVLACTSSPGPDGTVTGTCRALRPGTATLSTFTGPFAGDPHGPPQYTWQLAVTVVA
jgi:hypothetical protein